MINTVSTIFKERYGTKLKIQWTQDLKGKSPTFMSHWKNSFVYSRTLRQVSFPLFNGKNKLQAIAVASPVDNQDAIIFNEMADFLQLTVAEHIKLTKNNQNLIETEQLIHRSHKLEPNVIEFKNRKKDAITHIEFKKTPAPKKPEFTPIWISGDNSSISSHIAFSVHDWVSNWAFINAKEIPDLIWQDTNHWKNFPQITIFIPKIDKLDNEKLEILKRNLTLLNKKSKNKPLIIVTSSNEVSDELEELKHLFKHYSSNENVAPRAQAHFLLFHYNDTKPWTHYCKDSGKLFFLPFSQSPENIH